MKTIKYLRGHEIIQYSNGIIKEFYIFGGLAILSSYIPDSLKIVAFIIDLRRSGAAELRLAVMNSMFYSL